MKSTGKDDLSTQKQSGAQASAAAKKRFRIEKLEERIAPKIHSNPHSKWVGSVDSGASGDPNSFSSFY